MRSYNCVRGNFYFDLEVSKTPVYTPQLYLKDKVDFQSYLDKHAVKDKNLSIFIKPNLWLNVQNGMVLYIQDDSIIFYILNIQDDILYIQDD